MQVLITSRDDSVTNAMKKHAREKADKVVRVFNGITKVEMILGTEGQLHKAEIVLSLIKGDPLTAHATHENLNAAIDLATHQATRSLVKFKEKLRDHRVAGVFIPDEVETRDDLETYQDVIDNTDFGK